MNTAAFSDGILGLFNGNIAVMTSKIAPSLAAPTHPFDGGDIRYGVYKYNQLNRLTSSASRFVISSTLENTYTNKFFSSYTYDKNGNIETLSRADHNQFQFDILNCLYKSGSNQLDYVTDASLDPTLHNSIPAQQSLNYKYDAIGNLTKNVSEYIDDIEWTVYGKIKKITRTNSSPDSIVFDYDATGGYSGDADPPIRSY